MSNPQFTVAFTGGLGWTFYPYGDTYSLDPKWGEWHSTTGTVVQPEEEDNRFDVIGRVVSPEMYFVLNIQDYQDPTDPEAFITEPVFKTRIWKDFGFSENKEFEVFWVSNDETGLWTGDIKIVVPQAVRNWLGPDQLANYTIDWWPQEDSNDITRCAYGELVLR